MGAEAILLKTEFCGKKALLKLRSPKEYRDKALDLRIRTGRTKTEALMLHKAKLCGVRTPIVYAVSRKECGITMEFIEGRKLKDCLSGKTLWACREAGKMAAKLHGAGIIHGDLTTSNLIIAPEGVVFVDFGLSGQSNDREAEAVDLIGFKKTYFATHWRYPKGWKEFLAGYDSVSKAKWMEEKIAEIEARARYV